MYNAHPYFPSKIWAKKCALNMAKYGIFFLLFRLGTSLYSTCQFSNSFLCLLYLLTNWATLSIIVFFCSFYLAFFISSIYLIVFYFFMFPMYQLFSLKWQAHCFFETMSAKYSSVNNQFVSCSQVVLVFYEKDSSFSLQAT